MMKFVILDSGLIPGHGNRRGPVLTPQSYDLYEVLKLVADGVDIREVMPDGSYRKLKYTDARIRKAIDEGRNKVEKNEPKTIDIKEIMIKKDKQQQRKIGKKQNKKQVKKEEEEIIRTNLQDEKLSEPVVLKENFNFNGVIKADGTEGSNDDLGFDIDNLEGMD